MYRCENCYRYFDEPAVIEEGYGLPWPWTQRFDGCPYCRSTGMIGVVHDVAL